MSKITATRIDNDDQRLQVLPAHFGADFLRVEMALYDHLQKMAPEDYNGGYWFMYQLSNGAMYLAPAITDRKLRLTVDTNGYSGEVSGDAAGLITCLFVFNALCWKYPQREDYVDLFYKPTEQQPGTAQLVRALERISGMDSMSYHSLETAKIVALAALAAYHNQGGEV